MPLNRVLARAVEKNKALDYDNVLIFPIRLRSPNLGPAYSVSTWGPK